MMAQPLDPPLTPPTEAEDATGDRLVHAID